MDAYLAPWSLRWLAFGGSHGSGSQLLVPAKQVGQLALCSIADAAPHVDEPAFGAILLSFAAAIRLSVKAVR